MLLNTERALEIMEKYELDALVATTPENVYYLSGYGTDLSFHFAGQGFSCAIFPRREDIEPTLVIQSFELPEIAERPSWMPGLRALGSFPTVSPQIIGRSFEPTIADSRLLALLEKTSGVPNRQRLVGQTLRELGLAKARLGFDDVRAMVELQNSELVEATATDALNVFREIRVIKTPEEVALMTHANRILQLAIEGMGELCAEGVTMRELLRYFRSTMVLHGGYGSHAVGGGIDRPWLSYPNMEYRLKSGDVVYIDPAGHFKHYWADIGRTGVVGKPPQRFEKLYATLEECHRIAVPMLRPGVSTAIIKNTATEAVRQKMPNGFVPLIHSIGIDQYDHPQPVGDFLSADFAIEEGMMVNFETLYFEIGLGVMQLEDTYHVQNGEPHRLPTLSMKPLRVSGAP